MLLEKSNLNPGFMGFRILAPSTLLGVPSKKNGRANSRPVVDGESLNIKHRGLSFIDLSAHIRPR